MQITDIGTVTLNNGTRMPELGFGTWQLESGDEAKAAVNAALSNGYRLIDTAKIYGNETSVGQAISESITPRSEVFVTTKLWNSDQGYDSTFKAFDESMDRLGLDYLDLYLIHWPASDKRHESWKALEEIYKSERLKAIGVSNYGVEHLKEVLEHGGVVPAVNQIEFHPFIYKKQAPIIDFCKQHDIIVEAYSQLARANRMDEDVISDIAERKGKSNAQVMLRWAVQHGTVPIPKSSNEDHIRSNKEVFDFELSDEEMEQINNLSDDMSVL